MIDKSRRYELVHQEALRARELTEAQAAGILAITAIICIALVAGFTDNLPVSLWLGLVLVPVIFMGLMLLLAHRLGIAYAIIRGLDHGE